MFFYFVVYSIKRKRKPENGTTSRVPNGAAKKNSTVNNVKKTIGKATKPKSRPKAKQVAPNDSEAGLEAQSALVDLDSPNSAHLRVIESNRKKIRLNNDNTITILDITPKPSKTKASTATKVIKSSIKKKSPVKKTVAVKSVKIGKSVDRSEDHKNTAVLSVKQMSAKYNETYIQSKIQNKQIVFKGKHPINT